ncbi:MAG: type II secretion system major pseudopilin GspG [bacterium]|nr:type II secretion system major pseudopilin GspG [bacterium]
MSRRKRSARAGFTLLEVLLVIGILALLAAFVVPSISGAGKQARVKLTTAAIGRNGPISSALKRYQWDIGVYPDTDEGFEALYERPDSVEEDSGKWTEPYLDTPLEDLVDPWGNPFQYRYPGEANESEFDLWSFGPDGIDGTDDDIVSWKKK